jgi:hexosaminidase
VEWPAGKAGRWFAKGNGGDSFYSLEAILSADGGALVDGVIYFAKDGTWPGTAAGTFTAQKGAPRANGTSCVPPSPSPPSPPSPTLWPLPANYTTGKEAISLAADFTIACDGNAGCGPNTLLQTAFHRYTQQIFAEHGGGGGSGGIRGQSLQLGLLMVHVGSADERETLQLGMDESYSLEVGHSRSTGGELQATLSAPAVWGVLRGLETFAQLVRWDWDNHSHVIYSAPWMIEDKPRFPHRAFMIDTARHFQPLAVFGRLLDGMTACKLNTLHWHISDEQSVAFESAKYPKVWEGRWSEDERYSHADMAWVVEQARLRGIRVELELDFPAHASSFCVGYPQLCPNVPTNGREGQCGLDVSKNFTFEFVDGLVAELGTPAGGGGGTKQALFFEDFFHFGGDEVDTRCWGPPPGTNTNISGNYSYDVQIWNWLMANGNLSTVGFRDMGNYNPTTMQHYLSEALGYFYQKLDAIAISHGKTPVHWVEAFDALGRAGRLDKRSVIQICPSASIGMCGYSKTTIHDVVAAGYKAIYNDWSTYYLLHLDVTWEQVYETEPLANITDPVERALVLGGELCKWGETTDASVFDGKVWPRLAAAAETFWSPFDPMRTAQSAEARMEWFRCRLLKMGIGASPLHGSVAGQAPSGPGSCTQ